MMHNCQVSRCKTISRTYKAKFITSVVIQPGTCYSKRHTIIINDNFDVFRIKVWEQIRVFKQNMWQYVERLLGDFGTNSCVVLLVCWHQILSDDVYFHDFDSETGHGINGRAQCPTGTRTQELSHTMRALEPDDRPVTISLCLNRFVPESARNRADTN